MTPLDPIPVEASPAAPTQEERTLGLLVWLIDLAIQIIGPWLLWKFASKGSAYIDHHAKTCVNHTITVLLLILIACVVFGGGGWLALWWDWLITAIVLLCVPLVVLVGLVIFTLVIHLIGAVKALRGVRYTPPLCWRFVR